MAPWYAVPPLFSTRSRAPIAGPWLLGAHAVLVILAARWIGVQTHAGWPRVALLAAAGVAVAGMTRRRA